MRGEKMLRELLEGPRHIAIIAGTGAGKTTLAKMLIRIAQQQGYRTVVVDWHGEYTGLPAVTYPISIEAGLLPEVMAHIVEEESRTPGYSTYLAVQKALEEMNDFEDDLVNILLKLAEVSYSLRLGAHAAAARLEAVKDLVVLSQNVQMQRGSYRLDLSRLGYTAAKTLAAIYTYQLYSFLKRNGGKEKTLIVLEESQNYSRPSKFLRELRHSGVKIIEIMQYMPSNGQHASLLANCNLAIGATGAYAAELITRYRFNPEIMELRDGEFMVFLGSKVHRIRVF